jgi:hypothetical protein
MGKFLISLGIALLVGFPLGNALETWFLSSSFASDSLASTLIAHSFYIGTIGTILALVRVAFR